MDNSFVVRDVHKCGGCHEPDLDVLYDFGLMPIAGYFPVKEEKVKPRVEMKLLKCDKCNLIQISPDLEDKELFTDYRYVSSVGMQNHFNELANWFFTNYQPDAASKILEIGCNDGPLLDELRKLGLNPLGIDPATNIVELARNKGLTVINDFFDSAAISKYSQLSNLDYIFSSNSFAHISDIHTIAESVSKSLAEDGLFIVEVQSFVELIKLSAFDFIYHEHKYYYTLESIKNLFAQFGMYLIDGTIVKSHGGSYRLVFSKRKFEESRELQQLLNSESEVSMGKEMLTDSLKHYLTEIEKLRLYLSEQKSQGKVICGFGASGRANMLLGNLLNSSELIDFVIDESPERIDRLMAQNLIPVVNLDQVSFDKVDIVVILAWNYKETIIKKINSKNVGIIIPLPSFELINC